MKRDQPITGNMGLCMSYRLSRMGWNVMPATRIARGIDLIGYGASGPDFTGMKVKALSKRNPVPLRQGLDRTMGDYGVAVNNLLRELAQRNEKDGRVFYCQRPASHDHAELREARDRIGRITSRSRRPMLNETKAVAGWRGSPGDSKT